MKFLITGASGLIGKKLVEKLLSNGFDINILTTSKNLNSNHLKFVQEKISLI